MCLSMCCMSWIKCRFHVKNLCLGVNRFFFCRSFFNKTTNESNKFPNPDGMWTRMPLTCQESNNCNGTQLLYKERKQNVYENSHLFGHHKTCGIQPYLTHLHRADEGSYTDNMEDLTGHQKLKSVWVTRQGQCYDLVSLSVITRYKA